MNITRFVCIWSWIYWLICLYHTLESIHSKIVHIGQFLYLIIFFFLYRIIFFLLHTVINCIYRSCTLNYFCFTLIITSVHLWSSSEDQYCTINLFDQFTNPHHVSIWAAPFVHTFLSPVNSDFIQETAVTEWVFISISCNLEFKASSSAVKLPT